MRLRIIFASLAILGLTAGVVYAVGSFSVKPGEFDPAHTFLVQAQWLDGIGCPTNGRISTDGSTTTPYPDAGCPTGDASDQHNQGLLLAKTGPTPNFAAAVAQLNGVKGMTLSELGYDIRKSGGAASSALGSHCGAGAPRFDVVTDDGTDHFVGCNSPAATVTASSSGYGFAGTRQASQQRFPRSARRTKCGASPSSSMKVRTEAEDPTCSASRSSTTIDVNGTLVGSGANQGEKGKNGKGDKDDNGDKGDRDND